jgi:hypothetical protein
MKFNIFSKKSKKPDRNKETKNKAEISLNKREYERYFIEGIEIEGLGSVLDVSNKGFRVKKEKPEDIEGELFEIPVEDKTLS